jgi:hypothetical protein
MKTITIFLVFIFSYHLSEAQTKDALFKKIENLLNKAEGKSITYPNSNSEKNQQYVLKKQEFRKSLIAIHFADGKNVYSVEHSQINWDGAFEDWVRRTDKNDPAISLLDIEFENDHPAKLAQDGKVNNKANSNLATLYFLTSDREELKNLLNAMAKLYVE